MLPPWIQAGAAESVIRDPLGVLTITDHQAEGTVELRQGP